jgi:hypothetical protein
MKETFAALLFGVAIALVVACGGSKAMKAGAPVSQSPGAGVMNPTARDQISILERQIADDLAKMQLAPPPSPMAMTCPAPPCAEPAAATIKPKDDPQCKPAASQTCKDSCTLADSICDNAKKICDIATELRSDVWANDKCTSGNASCVAAHDKCCGCS